MKSNRLMMGLFAAGWLALNSCVVEPKANADKFVEAIPTADDVKLKEPVGSQPGSSPQGFEGLLSAQADPPASAYATYYKFTRNLFDGVNLGTGYILGSVWIIVHYPPSSLSDQEAVWGPWTEALSPAEYRFRATEVAPGEFDYALEARNKKSSDDFAPILFGRGYGRDHARHQEGSFTIDYDKANEIDPTRLNADDESGSLQIDYALSSFPTTIDVKSAQTATGASFDVTVTAERAGGGRVRVLSHDDIDDAKETAMEDVTMNSRWLGSGAGRADVTVSHGDLPEGLQIQASECWSSDFARTYWTDNASLEPAEGDVAECPFAEPEY